ncbi:MAG: alanine racemase [Bacteroidetes bacterium]|nr:alanine racemase [Bacteroidota bacterium]
MFSTSKIEISKSALANNLNFIRDLMGPNVQFSSVIKGNAYGHHIELFAPIAEQCGVDHFSVFSADEALRVLKVSNGVSTIMIMGQIDNQEIKWAIENDIEFFIFEPDRLEATLEIAKKTGRKAKVHLEVETGMNRTGFEPTEMPRVIELLQNNPDHLAFQGLCTHYAGAESIANYYRVKKQKITFSKLQKALKLEGLHPVYNHTACSAAAMRFPTTRMDMVRIGILQYGFFPSREVMVDYMTRAETKEIPLKRLISWKSKIMDVKHVKTGEFIGYGTSFLANRDMIVATVPVGYSHGFSRSLSNQGRVLVQGARVSVIGTVNMNMMTIDVTELESVKKGDEVVLIGKQGDLEISVSSFGEFSDQLNYELLTRLPNSIPREVVD